ncbi:MAG: ABC transporter permease [Muribaculaceae bacterium]|nr:ABC transporter permease [Muribaculaceae bacterium]
MLESFKRGMLQLASRRIYIFMMLIVPIAFALFFINLMNEGLPLKVPVGMVDMDHSTLSRRIGRSLNAMELIDITQDVESYHKAMDKVRSGELYGFFYIPSDFQEKALSGKTPTLSFYSNMSIFVPGSLSFKGFKTIAVTTAGAIVQTTLVSAGADDAVAGSMLQPFNQDIHPLGNPWTNYSIYLCQSFIPAMMALLVMLVTTFSICQEIKRGTSVEWLATARGSMALALAGKLLPQTIIFSAVGVFLQSILFCYLHFPLNNHALHIVFAMILLVMSSQAFAVLITELLPNARLSMSMVSLIGILSFSIAGFSFPVDKMYGGIAIFSYILPIRNYFLIYIDQALNGIPLYYSRIYYIVMLGLLLLPLIGLKRLRKHCLNPVYVP